jgi:hypothetical protein
VHPSRHQVTGGDALTVSLSNFVTKRDVDGILTTRCSDTTASASGTPLFSVKAFDDSQGPVLVETVIPAATPAGTYVVQAASKGGRPWCSQPFFVTAK